MIQVEEFIARVDSIMNLLNNAITELKSAKELAKHNANVMAKDKNPHHPWCSYFKTIGWTCDDAIKIIKDKIEFWETTKNNRPTEAQ